VRKRRPGETGPGAGSEGRDLVRRRSRDPLRCPRREHLGSAGTHPDRLDDRCALWAQPDLGGQPTGRLSLHGSAGTGERRRVPAVPAAAAPGHVAPHLPHRGRSSDAQSGQGAAVPGDRRRSPRAVLPAAVLAGTQSRRVRLERPEEHGIGAQGADGIRSAETGGAGSSAAPPEASWAHPIFLSRAVNCRSASCRDKHERVSMVAPPNRVFPELHRELCTRSPRRPRSPAATRIYRHS